MANLTAEQYTCLVIDITEGNVVPDAESAREIAEAINRNAYFGLGAHLHRNSEKKVSEAAALLLRMIEEHGYPMREELARLHLALEAAMPLLELRPRPNYEAYVPAALTIHGTSCLVCEKAGYEPGQSRQSYAVRITTAVLTRIGYSVTPGVLEGLFQRADYRAGYEAAR